MPRAKHDTSREWVIEAVDNTPEMLEAHEREYDKFDWGPDTDDGPSKEVKKAWQFMEARQARDRLKPENRDWYSLKGYKWPKSIVECLTLYRVSPPVRMLYCVARDFRHYGLRLRNIFTNETIPIQELLGDLDMTREV